ncbi:MAG TPA: hypothetical protein VM889_05930 [Candidatus Thermoplasmatota archaeon]|nr:hypothetical protein [Candidatus Thermoplasmatota archaeon]
MASLAVDALGVIGLVALLGAFIANTAGKLAATSDRYLLLNILGSGILTVYSVLIAAWVFFPLELVWTAVAAWQLYRKRVRPVAGVV